MSDFGNTLVVTGVTPDVVESIGGHEFVLAGAFKDEVALVDVLTGGVAYPCYSGKSGQGYEPRPLSPTLLRAVTPPLPVGGPYEIRVTQGADVVITAPVITVLAQCWRPKVYDFRKRFPPWWDTGLRRLDLEELLGGEGMVAYKTADESIVNSDVPALDGDIVRAVLAGKKYRVHALLRFNVESGEPGVRALLTGTATLAHKEGLAVAKSNDDPVTETLADHAALDTLDITHTPPGAAEVAVEIRGTVEVSAGGTLGVAWSQATSHADATTLLRGSYLLVEPI